MATVRTPQDRAARGIPAAPASLTEDAVIEVLELEEQPTDAVAQPDPETRHEMIAAAAYHIAEQRGFQPGHELADWLSAERSVDSIVGGRAGTG